LKSGLTGTEVLGAMENMDENKKKEEALKQQIKAINEDTNEMVKAYAQDWETKPKDIKKVYKQYQDMKKSDNDDSDFWSLTALLEEALEDEGDDLSTPPSSMDEGN
jgi:uncharacterized protein YoxC